MLSLIKRWTPRFIKDIYRNLWIKSVDIIYHSKEIDVNYDKLTIDDLCEHKETVLIRKYPKRILRCKKCQIAFDVYRPKLKERDTSYDEKYFIETTHIRKEIFEERFPYLICRAVLMWGINAHEFVPPNNRFLDVGCGVGMMLKLMQFFGLEVEGIEQSQWAVEYCKNKLKIENVRCGEVIEANYPTDYFGMISLIHILEHLNEPVPTLKEVYRVLAPNGIVFGEVPYSEGLKDYGISDHFWFYNEPALKYLLSCIGFREILIKNGTNEPKMHNVPFLSFRAKKLK